MIETVFVTFVGLVALLFVVMHVGGPLLVWRVQKLPALARFQPLPQPQFLAKRNAEFHRYHNAWLDAGYELCGSTTLDDPNSSSFLSLYVHPPSRTAATVTSIHNSAGDEVTYAEVTQEFEDGTTLDVMNSSQPGAFPKIAWKYSFCYPELTEVEQLIDHHRRIRDHLMPRKSAKPVSKDNAFQEISEFIRRESDELARMGFCHREISPEGTRRLTLLGAVTMTWKLLLPGRWIWGFILRRRARRALGHG